MKSCYSIIIIIIKYIYEIITTNTAFIDSFIIIINCKFQIWSDSKKRKRWCGAPKSMWNSNGRKYCRFGLRKAGGCGVKLVKLVKVKWVLAISSKFLIFLFIFYFLQNLLSMCMYLYLIFILGINARKYIKLVKFCYCIMN